MPRSPVRLKCVRTNGECIPSHRGDRRRNELDPHGRGRGPWTDLSGGGQGEGDGPAGTEQPRRSATQRCCDGEGSCRHRAHGGGRPRLECEGGRRRGDQRGAGGTEPARVSSAGSGCRGNPDPGDLRRRRGGLHLSRGPLGGRSRKRDRALRRHRRRKRRVHHRHRERDLLHRQRTARFVAALTAFRVAGSRDRGINRFLSPIRRGSAPEGPEEGSRHRGRSLHRNFGNHPDPCSARGRGEIELEPDALVRSARSRDVAIRRDERARTCGKVRHGREACGHDRRRRRGAHGDDGAPRGRVSHSIQRRDPGGSDRSTDRATAGVEGRLFAETVGVDRVRGEK